MDEQLAAWLRKASAEETQTFLDNMLAFISECQLTRSFSEVERIHTQGFINKIKVLIQLKKNQEFP